MQLANHLDIAPIILPLVTGAFLLLFDERRHTFKSLVNIAATLGLLLIAGTLVAQADVEGSVASVYLLGNWAAPYGIVLVVDRLSAMMLLLTALLATAALVFSLARWHKAGPHFHSLFQFLLMGLNGAFLTGDLFNLFVFFEVLLAASYGLMLHGLGVTRVRFGMHYIAVNLAASMLFLIGVSLIYGVTGTLNMADLAVRIPAVPAQDRALLEAGTAILGIAFLTKAGIWPLCFWLPGAYSAAAAPVAAIFSIMTKVGVYAVLRLSPLLLGARAGDSASFGDVGLLVAGLVTMAFGTIGVLASQAMARLVSYSVLVSSGTLLAAVGMADAGVTTGALFYMVSSTLTIGALFLLVELVDRSQDPAANVLAVTMEAYGDDPEEEEIDEEVGVTLPATLAILGICFVLCGLLLSGLPPLSGFLGKFALLSAALSAGDDGAISGMAWAFFAVLIISGLFAMVAMLRVGIRTFWAPPIEGVVPRVLVVEFAPVALLLALCVVMTVKAGPVMAYVDATSQSLHSPDAYIEGVLSARQVPSPKMEAGR
ncbi:monovalent cation/H+ antiporter subunit D [Aquamicrobium sp. NLF2-7]|jgi:multicomponent K+:H+ antiporter subunit D|uniref:Multicomponent K+:H+ antiporter subunit D n=1 Tax=Aquamicrobium lusatiense TaxID=89772 RepID=A0A7W9S1C8_9HYPH|nr:MULTISPECIES: monovalent cation/H+ antiporter subunit D [Aquamicrobium]MBB6011168.1 multicomponent K+:H+ antiporter subunit D [Aquamicrobium lusatiense]MCG8271961.1 monovalent cation/H+ antiporter subunit D [Aquamicrobium sp. NLF2-7]MCK9552160.1 monovalent cation/H+ antiporter subunit D [Aquamicrobium sp.]